MISGWISYGIIFFIGLSLFGIFGDTRNYTTLYGIVLVLLFVWWVLRRSDVIPAF